MMTVNRTLVVLALVVGCHGPRAPEAIDTEDEIVATAADTAHAHATSRCTVRGPLPDPSCTPGAVFAGVTREQVCVPGYAKSVRNVPSHVKREVLAAYGITVAHPGDYEIDHLVSLQLGGSNEVANLWPEAAEPRPGFHEKDRIENELHRRMCRGEASLVDVQRAIAADWRTAGERIGGR